MNNLLDLLGVVDVGGLQVFNIYSLEEIIHKGCELGEDIYPGILASRDTRDVEVFGDRQILSLILTSDLTGYELRVDENP